MKAEIEEAAKKFSLNEENGVTVAAIAENFGKFEHLSAIVLKQCRATVPKSPDDRFGFAKKYLKFKSRENLLM